jgi:hypothetical protein
MVKALGLIPEKEEKGMDGNMNFKKISGPTNNMCHVPTTQFQEKKVQLGGVQAPAWSQSQTIVIY